MSQRFVVFILPESAAIGDHSIAGPWRSYGAAEEFIRTFQAKRGYLSCVVTELLSPADARASWEHGEGEGQP